MARASGLALIRFSTTCIVRGYTPIHTENTQIKKIHAHVCAHMQTLKQKTRGQTHTAHTQIRIQQNTSTHTQGQHHRSRSGKVPVHVKHVRGWLLCSERPLQSPRAHLSLTPPQAFFVLIVVTSSLTSKKSKLTN